MFLFLIYIHLFIILNFTIFLFLFFIKKDLNLINYSFYIHFLTKINEPYKSLLVKFIFLF
jgi:hypothetical protein